MALEYVVKPTEHGVRLSCTGGFEATSVERFEAAVEQVRDGAKVIELDLSAITSIDEAGLRALIETIGRLEVKGVVARLVPGDAVANAASRDGVAEILGL